MTLRIHKEPNTNDELLPKKKRITGCQKDVDDESEKCDKSLPDSVPKLPHEQQGREKEEHKYR